MERRPSRTLRLTSKPPRPRNRPRRKLTLLLPRMPPQLLTRSMRTRPRRLRPPRMPRMLRLKRIRRPRRRVRKMPRRSLMMPRKQTR